MLQFNLPLKRVSEVDLVETLLFLRFLDFVYKTEVEGNEIEANDFFSESEIKIYREFLSLEGDFQYDLFFFEFHKITGNRFHLIINGYQNLVEKFCDIDSPILEISPEVSVQEKGTICLPAEIVFEFSNFSSWKETHTDLERAYDIGEKIIYLDKKKNALTKRDDFMHARDSDMFPVTAYRLIRNTEEKIIKSIRNN